ncbi:retention module-containing protein, partial [Methylophaga sp. UBA1464]
MATEAGIISALIGTATATAVDGTVRNLQVGDKVYPNEIITTGLAGAIEIEFPDGSVMDLGRNSQAVLDTETFELDIAESESPAPLADDLDDIEAIQQALLAGEDPTQIADPTAA